MDTGKEHDTDFEDLMDVMEGKKFRIKNLEATMPSPNQESKPKLSPRKKKRRSKALFETKNQGAPSV